MSEDNPMSAEPMDAKGLAERIYKAIEPYTFESDEQEVRLDIAEAVADFLDALPGQEQGGISSSREPSTSTGSSLENQADYIVSALYRRFKDWSKRGFGADDVTWCEVKADVLALISLSRAPQVERDSSREDPNSNLPAPPPPGGDKP